MVIKSSGELLENILSKILFRGSVGDSRTKSEIFALDGIAHGAGVISEFTKPGTLAQNTHSVIISRIKG